MILTSRVRYIAWVAGWMLWDNHAVAQTLWTENAESGLTNVIDNTDASYPLIQSDVVGQGDYAFHLANPGFQDNSFVIDRTITIEPDTKLFFLSRLRYATPTQIARVQISTDGGSTWPTNIFNQSGDDGPGEGAFSQKQIDLGSYANQDLRFRFYYDFTGGSAYTDTDSAVGWFVDDIQIGSEFAKIPWSIGDPSPHAQQYLEYINRARADALTEAVRLRDESDPDIQSAYGFYNIEGQDIVDQFTWYVNNGAIDQHAQPLSFQEDLLTAAELHTQDMFQNEFQAHNSSSTPPAPFQPGYTLGQRLDAVGYDGSAGENIFSYADSVAHGHAGFDVDWGNTSSPGEPYYNPAFDGQGMQNPAGHRRNLHNDDFKEIGIGVVNDTNGSVGPQLVTQDFGNPGDVSYVTGVVYEDLNGNSFYDVGEGRSGVRVDVDGSAFYAISGNSGGYSVPVSQDGDYSVTFSGGGFQPFSTSALVTDGRNVKIDYLAALVTILAGDYNDDGMVDAADYTVWRDSLGQTFTLTGENPAAVTPGVVDQEDYEYWKANFGNSASGSLLPNTAVPEPATVSLWLLGAAAIGFACRKRSIGRGGTRTRTGVAPQWILSP